MSDLPETPNTAASENLAAAGSGYELLKQRLAGQGESLTIRARALNDARLKEFGHSELSLVSRLLARTENNCVARDIVRVGDLLLFGYNVFMGLRKETGVGDVFSLYRLREQDGNFELEPQALAGSFLGDTRFLADFRELYAYYKQTTLTRLSVQRQKLLAAFQIGEQISDVRVFRWSIGNDGGLSYIDNRGERDYAPPPAYDFEWQPTTREQHVQGRHPHINILDTVFVETVGGDLTVKIENNTESGLGIYAEPVEDRNQSLADADIAYARLGALILLSIRPYREETIRYLVFNTRTQQVLRVDAIGKSCVQLPENHGIIFPGGYLLQSGECKRFDLPAAAVEGQRFSRSLRSPNGEDVLYVFYEPVSGSYGLFTYNLIEKSLGTPLLANGYAEFDDGRFLIFQADHNEPVRSHPMQVWQTPFCSEDHSRRQNRNSNFYTRIGNAELVRAVSELLGVARAVREQAPTRVAYEDLIRECGRVQDAHFWLAEPEAGAMAQEIKAVAATARATLDEFDKVAAIRRQATRALNQAQAEQHQLLTDIAATLWHQPTDFVTALSRLQAQRGKLMALRELRYMDTAALATMDATLAEEEQRVGEKAVQFLAGEKAFDAYRQALERISEVLAKAGNTQAIAKAIDELDSTAKGLDLLTELMSSLPGGDATVRSHILDSVAGVYAELNRIRAAARNQRKALGAQEASAEFGAQLRLLGQAVENALDLADSPEKCDEALTRLLARLEEMEGRFGEHEEFLTDIASKRDAIYEGFASRKQTLLDTRARRSQALQEASQRILAGVPRRVEALVGLEAVHAYFASDPLIAKLRGQVRELRGLGAEVEADDLDTRLKSARDQALRAIRDRQELVAGDGASLRLGRHAFTINRQPLELTLIPRGEALVFHLNGTDYYAPVQAPELEVLKPYWAQTLVAETPALYRAEFLAGQMLEAARNNREGLSLEPLRQDPNLVERVRQFAAPRYLEGYQKGVHDHDAALILAALLAMEADASLLAYGPRARALAAAYWSLGRDMAAMQALQRHARSRTQLRQLFGADDAHDAVAEELTARLCEFGPALGFFKDDSDSLAIEAAEYLLEQLGSREDSFIVSAAGDDLAQSFSRHLERAGQLKDWRAQIEAASGGERWLMVHSWLRRYTSTQEPAQRPWLDDACAVLALSLPRQRRNAQLEQCLEGLLGEHGRIVQGSLTLNLNDFSRRYREHVLRVVPAFNRLQALRQDLLTQKKTRLRLEQFQAQPLTSFVRNRLLDEVYLPLVGDNLAKQLGAAGEAARTDRMGMLLLISPPGYGKTTLMEYVADRLGLIFVRINCPALGHEVVSLDPAQAPHGSARSELEKLNLGLAMGNNVMLYLDDIQHTHPEFLQKFIALCDGTRRIEGVWNGAARSYDLRGKRFAMVMAGNPYTESGEVFKIPDMLANRADVYNLGDVLSGREALFALSYIENSLTANPALLPLSTRDPKDVQLLVQLANGEDVPGTAFSYAYGAAELNELVAICRHLFRLRDALLRINQAYIASAAQADSYRDEPPFKLQGSYRNMSKLAARVSAAMLPEELDALLRDHYRGEAQTLTTGAEENLLKLAQLLGSASAEENSRWQAILEQFRKIQRSGDPNADGATRVARVLADIAAALEDWRRRADGESQHQSRMQEGLERLHGAIESIKTQVTVSVPEQEGLNEAVRQMAELYTQGLAPLVTATHYKMKLDHSIWEKIRDMSHDVQRLGRIMENGKPVRGHAEKSAINSEEIHHEPESTPQGKS